MEDEQKQDGGSQEKVGVAVPPHQRSDEATVPKVPAKEIECPVSKKAAARILGVSVATLDNWTARGLIPHIKYDVDGNTGNRGKVLYLAIDLLAFRRTYRRKPRDVGAEVDEIMAELTA